MSNIPTHSVSVAGIVVNDAGEILVIKRRDNGHWEPPGGILELPETFQAGVRREVLEETGITVTVDRLTGAYKNLNRGIVALVFRCTPASGTAHATSEAVAVRWMPFDDVATSMDPAYAIRIADAFQPSACHRAHNGVDLVTD